jgi:hypothetical protein
MPVSPKRGAFPSPRNVLAAAAPYHPRIGAPPNFITVPAQLSIWGNDVHGDCVTAEEAFAKACNNPEIFIPEDVVITWATNHGVLEGAFLPQVLQFMQDDGFPQNTVSYDDGPYFSVDWTNSTSLQSAIATGPVKLGVAADQLHNQQGTGAWDSTGGNTGWFATGFHTDTNEDHCVSLCGYGTIAWLAQQLNVQVPNGINGTNPGYALFTWNSIGIIDVPSMIAITQEAWVRNPTTDTHRLGGWNGDWFPLPGQAVFDHVNQQVAAVSRAPGNLDLFIVGFDNRVWTTFWNDQVGWNGDWFPLPGQAVFDHANQHVAAVSRAPGNLDTFIVGFDNRVWTTFWNDQVGWNGDWFPLPGQAVFDHVNQHVAAVSRAPANLDTFIVGLDNHVWTTFWNG